MARRTASEAKPAGKRSRGSTPPKAGRSTAAQRREVLVAVASRHFAERGYYGTPTLAIADEAGISQAYLFRLFPTKEDLFAACVTNCIDKTRAAFESGVASRRSDESELEAMGRAYVDLLRSDPEVLLGQLHASAAATREPKIRKALQEGWGELYETASRISGASPEEIRGLFAAGMLINIAAAAGFDQVNEPWAMALGIKEQPRP
jgi:AcrR family transcriptional regulator